ncbi:MAG: hypothetical protein DSZ23_06340 [Thermodesulfatator sp.]|nr:MAG: hypothetical protein DSZ23_06340 [Thermodesulfatator sp.]
MDVEKDKSTVPGEEYEVLKIHVRPDLYRAFRRCVWMTVHETGMSIVEIHNKMIEDLLKSREC